MSNVGSRQDWLTARVSLLAEEKELTRRSDELARRRQALPWVAVEKDYAFEADDGTKTLADLFDGRSQLLVYHFMFGPTVEAGRMRGVRAARTPRTASTAPSSISRRGA